MDELVGRGLQLRGSEYLDHFPAVVVQGARQAGKSTLAQMLVENRPHAVVTLDDSRVRDAVAADPWQVVEQIPEGTLVIDEVQRLPELLLTIKASIDRDRRPGRFILTGSSNILKAKGGDSLAGRAIDLRLRGLSQAELSGTSASFVDRLVADGVDWRHCSTSLRRADYLDVLERGAFPEARRLSRRMRGPWLDSYLSRLMTHDLAEVPGGGNEARLRRVLSLLAANQSGELVKARIASATGISESMIGAYVDALRSVYLIDLLQPWTPSLTKRETGRSKASLADSALAMRLNSQTAASLAPLTADGIGPLLESFVVGELMSQGGWSEEEYRLFHYRDRNGLEVDLIVELMDGRVLGIEVKASSTFRAEHFKGLVFLKESLGDRFLGGIVLGTAGEGYQYAERLWGLPVAALW
ncbi:ATP-binding protein [Actinomyces slackii]|uniref:Archaeal ATPase n=1 Tax=Actinomyces slackii TaxID=52774 RepID=A0A3S5EM46_9ACTO|nr:ATP-binding protein [Actinomyces slackii]VEG74166.1 Uncharacterised protein [Actinomyces slackii]